MRLLVFLLTGMHTLAGCQNSTSDASPPISPQVPGKYNRAPVLYGTGEQSYGITCHYYYRHTDRNDPKWGTYVTGYVWGEEDGRSVYVRGQFEDGFFVANGMYISNKEITPASLTTLTQICNRSIQEKFPDKGYQLLKAMAYRYTDYFFEYPIVFNSDSSQLKTPRIVLFGDSLSDTGNIKNWIKKIPGSPYFDGRFADFLVWIDFMAMQTGASVQNWAYGGAQSEPYNDIPANDIVKYVGNTVRNFISGSFSSHVEHYIDRYLIDRQIQHPEKTLFFIWIGANDYAAKFDKDIYINTLLDDPTNLEGAEYVTERTTVAIVKQIEKLYQAGARKFAVVNLPDIGSAPAIAQNTTYHRSDILSSPEEKRYRLSLDMTEVSQTHNGKLKIKLEQAQKFMPDAQIIHIDIYDFLLKIIANQSSVDGSHFDYGFNFRNLMTRIEPEDSREPSVDLFKACYTGPYSGSNTPRDVTCSNVSRAMYYDTVHPTSYGQCWINYHFLRNLYDNGLYNSDVDKPEASIHKDICMKAITP